METKKDQLEASFGRVIQYFGQYAANTVRSALLQLGFLSEAEITRKLTVFLLNFWPDEVLGLPSRKVSKIMRAHMDDQTDQHLAMLQMLTEVMEWEERWMHRRDLLGIVKGGKN